jgi:hypothetical protein
MLMILANSPEEVRAEVVKYITWRIGCERSNYAGATTQRDMTKYAYAKAVLENVLKDLTEVVITAKES